jgi:UDP:flavonoid glycosyltransferase YjiC (YdhE family)
MIVTYSDRGHANALLAIAQRLEQAGHELVIASVQEPLDARVAGAGLAAATLCVMPPSPHFAPPPRRSIELGRLLGNARWLQRWLGATLLDPLPQQVEALRRAAREHRTELVVVDAMAYGGAIAAELAGLPWASVATTLQSLPPPSGPLGVRCSAAVFAALDAVRAERTRALGVELRFRLSDALSPRLNLWLTSPALLARAGLTPPPDVCVVGAALPHDIGAVPAQPPARPLVYVAFGSHLSPPESVYAAIGAALHADEAEVTMALKDLIDEPFVRAFPAHVRAVAFAPQLELLARARVMVHHGGANSVMECLAHGVPMLVLPLGYDQPICADLVERAGVGHAVELEATAARWRELLLPLLRDDAPEREVARRLDAREDGATRAAELIAAL